MELSPDTLAAHDDAVRRREPMYQDPATGLWVMTAYHLRDRGYCCESGCRHCPYRPNRGDPAPR